MYTIEKLGFNFRKFDIEIDQVAYANLDTTWKNKNVSHPCNMLYFVKKGIGYHCSGNRTTVLRAGHIYLVPAGYTYDYYTDSNLEKLYFSIYVNTMEHYDLLSYLNEIYEIPFEDNEYDKLKECVESEDYYRYMEMKMILYKSLLRMAQLYGFGPVPAKHYSQNIKLTMELIRQSPSINCNIESLSDKLFLSPSTLRKDFRAETGITIGKYIDDMVFQKAKRLLSKENIPISKISQELGFCDQFYFSRRFKQLFGVTPSEYRKKLQYTSHRNTKTL